jgi:hypothetical protein
MATQQNPRSLANLRPPWKPGECGNKSSVNAVVKALAEFRVFMGEKTASGKSRLYNVWERLYLSAAAGDTKAGIFVVEQTQGKAPEVDSSLALAEHFRRVERDRVDIALTILGSRITAMDPTKLAEFFRSCAVNPLGFVQAAQAFLREQEAPQTNPLALESPPPAALEPEPAR